MFDPAVLDALPEAARPRVRYLRVVLEGDGQPDDAELPGARLAELLTVAPCAATLAELELYADEALSAADRVVVLQVRERHIAWMTGRQQEEIVAVAGPAPRSSDDEDWAELDVAVALRLSAFTASRRVTVARQLCGRLVATGQALRAGKINFYYALSLVEAVADLDDRSAVRVEAALLAEAGQLTLARFRAKLHRAVIAAAPKAADERHAAAAAQRRVVVDPQPDGMAWLSAFLTAPEAIAAYHALDAAAHASVGLAAAPGAGVPPPRTDHDPIGVLRADALVAALLDSPAGAAATGSGAPAGDAAPRGGRQVTVQVTVDLPTLVRLAEHPAELAGYGPIPPELARRLAADGIWQRLIVDPADGHLLDYGRTTYRPPRALVDYLHARDVTCRFPGCGRRAQRCDLDHAESWQCEGSTCSPNMGALCRRHHRAKTHAGWKLASHPDGSATWTSPRGHPTIRPPVNHAPEHVQRLRDTADNAASSKVTEPTADESTGPPAGPTASPPAGPSTDPPTDPHPPDVSAA